MSLNKILNADTLLDLIDAINDFCRESYTTDIDSIYTEFDEHMKRVINMEFFKRIIVQYLKE